MVLRRILSSFTLSRYFLFDYALEDTESFSSEQNLIYFPRRLNASIPPRKMSDIYPLE